MNKTMQRYRQAIQAGQVDPVRTWPGRSTAKLLDCDDDAVPLSVLSMDAFALGKPPIELVTGRREWLIVPIDGRWRVEVTGGDGRQTFAGDRTGGPFAAWPDATPPCNAQAVYLPRGTRATLVGDGEAVGFSAPAFDDRPPALLACDDDRPIVSRGSTLWRRDVVTLATPADATTNLILGETYSPPGLWSGTPLHVHDFADAGGAQSDHEEIYYHLAGRADAGGGWGAYAAQFLFDDQGLGRCYMVRDRTAFAIPGAAHPVVAGPNCEMMYLWCLASERSHELAMMDVPDFAWLKQVGLIVEQLEAERGPTLLGRGRFEQLADAAGFSDAQRRVLRLHLAQLGFAVEG